jgi:hypothetical protein
MARKSAAAVVGREVWAHVQIGRSTLQVGVELRFWAGLVYGSAPFWNRTRKLAIILQVLPVYGSVRDALRQGRTHVVLPGSTGHRVKFHFALYLYNSIQRDTPKFCRGTPEEAAS